MMSPKKLNTKEVIEHFQILQVPITSNIDSLRRARDKKLKTLYVKSSDIENPIESLALDTEIATIQRAYLYIKKHYSEIQQQIDVYSLLKEQFKLLGLPMSASVDRARAKRNELLLELIKQDSGKYSRDIEEKIKEVQNAFNFIVSNYPSTMPH